MLRELFRQKLDDAGIIPSPSVGDKLFRRLERREFLRFNPSRFNIWYTGLIAAACAAGLIFYLAGDDSRNAEMTPPEITEPVVVVTSLPESEGSDLNNPEDLTWPAEGRTETCFGEFAGGEENPQNATVDVKVSVPFIPVRSEMSNKSTAERIIPNPDPKSGKLINALQLRNSVIASAIEGCCPLKVIFEPGNISFETCRWTFGDGGVSDEINPEWIFDVEGEYKVTLNTYNSGKLVSVSTCMITVYPRPVARFEIMEMGRGVDDKKIYLANYSVNAIKYIWEFGDGNTSDLYEPAHTFSEPGDYNIKLIAVSEQGCTDTLTVINPLRGSENYIEFPNAFFPNLNGPVGGYYSSSSDDAAMVFHPVSSGVAEYQLRIFSKRGIMIFESYDINIGWDGYYKGQLCQSGVYIWKVRGKYLNGEPFTKMGDLILLKN